jgi:mono/diheme cytochrome c family protein
MRSRTRLSAIVLAVVGLGVSSVALGLPWDTDMADGQQRKGYSFEMKAPPEGAIAQPDALTGARFVPTFERKSPEALALVNPLPADDATVAQGKHMYEVYCAPCHGNGVQLGPVAQPGRFSGVAVLAGAAGVLPGLADGTVYLTIRNGGDRMPSYEWAMSDEEMWSVVSYVRTLDGAARKGAESVTPAPAPAEAP